MSWMLLGWLLGEELAERWRWLDGRWILPGSGRDAAERLRLGR